MEVTVRTVRYLVDNNHHIIVSWFSVSHSISLHNSHEKEMRWEEVINSMRWDGMGLTETNLMREHQTFYFTFSCK